MTDALGPPENFDGAAPSTYPQGIPVVQDLDCRAKRFNLKERLSCCSCEDIQQPIYREILIPGYS